MSLCMNALASPTVSKRYSLMLYHSWVHLRGGRARTYRGDVDSDVDPATTPTLDHSVLLRLKVPPLDCALDEVSLDRCAYLW